MKFVMFKHEIYNEIHNFSVQIRFRPFSDDVETIRLTVISYMLQIGNIYKNILQIVNLA